MVWSFTSESQQVTFWVVSVSPSQRGQTAEMSPPVASERVSVVVTWPGSLLRRFCWLGTLETVLCPSISRVYSAYSLNSKLMVMTMGFYLFLWGQEMTPMFVSHIFGPFPASVFLVGSFINIPPKPSSNYPTYGIVYQRPSVLLEEQPPPSHLPALPPVPSQVAKEAAVPWLKVSECVVCCLTAMKCTVACPSLSAVHDSRPSPPINSEQLRYRVSEFVQLGGWMGM